MEVENLRVMGRATQGVKLIRLNEKDEISSIAKIELIEGLEEDKIDSTEENPTNDDSTHEESTNTNE